MNPEIPKQLSKKAEVNLFPAFSLLLIGVDEQSQSTGKEYKSALDARPRKHMHGKKQGDGSNQESNRPVFTQEMKNDGKLPPVESLFFYDGVEVGVFKCNSAAGVAVYPASLERSFSISLCYPLGSKEHTEWIESELEKEGELRPVWDDFIPNIEKDMVVASDGKLFVIAEKPEKESSTAKAYDKNDNLCEIALWASEPPSAEFLNGWRERQKNSTPTNKEYNLPTKGTLTITTNTEGVTLSIDGVKANLSGNAGEAVMALHHLLKDESEAQRIAGLCDALSFDSSAVDLTNLLGES